MIISLRILFSAILLTMLSVSFYAVSRESLFNIPAFVRTDPWFTATLFDAYCGFLTFYAWVFYKTPSWLGRVIWLILILLLGNIAMASYMLWILFRLPASASAQDVLLRPASSDALHP